MNDVLWLEAVEFFDDDVVLNQELTVFLLLAVSVEIPTWGYGVFVEGTENWLFDVVGDGHVIFDGVQSSQYEVKYADLVNFKQGSQSIFGCFDRLVWDGTKGR